MQADFLDINGSIGEGGGQVLRSSLALSILTGIPIHLTSIRSGRAKPGLQPQHLKAVEAAAAISSGQVQGAAVNSREIFFTPGGIHGGRYHFDIGTAGSSSLVLHTIYLPLALAAPSGASNPSRITITGGTHVPFSPCFHYLEQMWLPTLQTCGLWIRAEMDRAGFYPQGGGIVQVHIRPQAALQPLLRLERGGLLRIRGITAVANLDEAVAKRQKHQALRRLEPICQDTKIETVILPSIGKGTMLLLQAEFEQAACCYFGLGALGKRAETVADEAVDALQRFLSSGAAVDEYLADQILLPLTFAAGESRFQTARVTLHLITNAAIINTFFPGSVQILGEEGLPGEVLVQPGRMIENQSK